jgi:hypothetical protein
MVSSHSARKEKKTSKQRRIAKNRTPLQLFKGQTLNSKPLTLPKTPVPGLLAQGVVSSLIKRITNFTESTSS